jgi:hypothetical protein
MKHFLLFMLLVLCIETSAQSNRADWYLNDDNNTGIQTPTNSATGDFTLATGLETIAEGDISNSTGYKTTALGNFSTAMGNETVAHSLGTLAIGVYNQADLAANPTTFYNTSTAFVIGNGQDNSNRSNAFKVLYNGDTFISGTVSATYFVGDASFLSNIPPPTLFHYRDLANKPFEFNSTSNTGIETNTNSALGDNTFAMGRMTSAEGFAATSTGFTTKAAGDYSFSSGLSTQANGEASLTSGKLTVASGDFATALGEGTQASAKTAFASGENTSATADHATALGIGTTASGPRSIAMGSGSEASGTSATAMGSATEAIGNYSFSAGQNSRAQGNHATAIGFATIAMGASSFAAGEGSAAESSHSIAMGNYAQASNSGAIALGEYTSASGAYAVAVGDGASAAGDSSVALGAGASANGELSMATGTATQANGMLSFASGYGTRAEDIFTIALGSFNTVKTNPSPNLSLPTNTLFVVGNGSSTERSNAIEILFDGTTTIAGDLNINSDARLKTNIISLGATLSKLLQIDGKTYTMKKDTNHKKKIGLLAQDIEKVFPELVMETNDIKSVNYQGLVPVLINAMKEQDEVIRNQDAVNKKQQQEIDELKAMVKTLINN